MNKNLIASLISLVILINCLTACANMGIFKEGGDSNSEKVETRMVKVGGIVCKDSGYVSSVLRCGTPDGTIKTTVKANQVPTNDDESNFGKGFEYQGREGVVHVLIDGEYVIFIDVDKKLTDIPSSVANFEGEISSINPVKIKVIDYPDMYAGKSEIGADGVLELNLKGVLAQSDIDNLTGKKVRVWFDGNIDDITKGRLDKIYKVQELLSDSSIK